MDQTALAQRGAHGLLHRGDQPGRAVGDHQQRAAQAAGAQIAQEPRPGVGGLGRRGVQPDEDRLAVGGDAPRGEHRLGRGAHVVAKEAGVKQQIVQLQLVETTLLPDGHLFLDLGADPRHRRPDTVAPSPRASAKVASTSRVDSPRTNPAMTMLSNAWVLVTPVPNNCEANASVVLRSLGRAKVTGPLVVLIVVSQ